MAGNSTGAVFIEGAGSNWTYNGKLIIGDDGIGTLNITGGGSLNTWVQVWARALGMAGEQASTVTVSGVGSSWTSTQPTAIGKYRTGTLTITDGGSVTATDMTIGEIYTSYTNGAVNLTGAEPLPLSVTNLKLGIGSFSVGRPGTLTIGSGTQVLCTNEITINDPGQ